NTLGAVGSPTTTSPSRYARRGSDRYSRIHLLATGFIDRVIGPCSGCKSTLIPSSFGLPYSGYVSDSKSCAVSIVAASSGLNWLIEAFLSQFIDDLYSRCQPRLTAVCHDETLLECIRHSLLPCRIHVGYALLVHFDIPHGRPPSTKYSISYNKYRGTS